MMSSRYQRAAMREANFVKYFESSEDEDMQDDDEEEEEKDKDGEEENKDVQ